MTIHRIGKKPKAAPSVADRTACPTGIRNARTASTSATAREIRPASHALTFSAPRSTNRVTSGIAATSALSASDPPTGSTTCSNNGAPSLGGEGARLGGGTWGGSVWGTTRWTARRSPVRGGGPGEGGAGAVERPVEQLLDGDPADRGVQHLDRVRDRHPLAHPGQRGRDLHPAAGVRGHHQVRPGGEDSGRLALAELPCRFRLQHVVGAGAAAA